MSKGDKPYEVGRGKPPRRTRFKAGKSGNPKGRPKGSKNFATVIAKELNGKVPITENGRSRRVSKREVIAKQLVNKAAGGDLKATQALMNESREREDAPPIGADLTVFDAPAHHNVILELVRRIRSMDEEPPAWPTEPDPDTDPKQLKSPPPKKRKAPKV